MCSKDRSVLNFYTMNNYGLIFDIRSEKEIISATLLYCGSFPDLGYGLMKIPRGDIGFFYGKILLNFLRIIFEG